MARPADSFINCSLYMILWQIPNRSSFWVDSNPRSPTMQIISLHDKFEKWPWQAFCNFRDNWDNCAFPFWGKNIPNFQFHTEVHFHQVANETYLSIFGHGFQAPGTTPFQRWRLAPHCAERPKVLVCFDDGSAKRDSSASP